MVEQMAEKLEVVTVVQLVELLEVARVDKLAVVMADMKVER